MKKQEFSLRFIRHQTFKNAQSEDLQRTQIKQTRFNIKKTKSAQIKQPDLAGRYMQYQTSKQFVEKHTRNGRESQYMSKITFKVCADCGSY